MRRLTKSPAAILRRARAVIDAECAAVRGLRARLGADFVEAVGLMLACRGKVVVTGVGKSGIIGRKISATLASTGTPSIFLHPGDAIHGDLGMVSPADIVLAISNSGETDEILRIVPSVKKIGATLVSATCSPGSRLAMESAVCVCTGEIAEADAFGLVPSSSAVCALVLGDAFALTLLQLKGFGKRDFAVYHPGGNLGRRLMSRVRDVMQTGRMVPKVREGAPLLDAVREINEKNVGFTLVVDAGGRLTGIITDGDLRRMIAAGASPESRTAGEFMTRNPRTVEPDRLAAQALAQMEALEITCLAIVDSRGRPRGYVHLHDLLGKKELSIEY